MKELQEYYKTLTDKSADTVRSYKYALENFVEFFNIQSLADLPSKPGQITEYINHLAEKNSNTTVNARIRVLRVFYNWLNNLEYIGFDPMKKIKNFKEPKTIPQVLTEEERDQMIAACRSLNQKLMIAMMFYTGLRRNEVTNIKLEDIRNGYLLIHGKGNKERSIPLNKFVLGLLDKYLGKRKVTSDYLFVSARGGHQITSKSVGQRVKSIMRRAGFTEQRISEIAAHSVRRSFACHLVNNDVNAFVIQKALGHEKIETTTRYIAGMGNKPLDNAILGLSLPDED